MLNDIYNNGIIPEDLSKSIFIIVPKCQEQLIVNTITAVSLMCQYHTTTLLLRILMQRARLNIGPEIGMEQCGFVRHKGTINAILMLRTLAE